MNETSFEIKIENLSNSTNQPDCVFLGKKVCELKKKERIQFNEARNWRIFLRNCCCYVVCLSNENKKTETEWFECTVMIDTSKGRNGKNVQSRKQSEENCCE